MTGVAFLSHKKTHGYKDPNKKGWLGPGDSIPDSDTLWDFRENLDKTHRDGVGHLFLHFEKPLSHQGVIAKEVSILNASFVDAPRQKNTREQNHEIKKGNIPKSIDRNPHVKRQKGLDGRWAKKNQETHYRYKNHAKVDLKKLVMNYKKPSDNFQDSQVWQDLLDERVPSIPSRQCSRIRRKRSELDPRR